MLGSSSRVSAQVFARFGLDRSVQTRQGDDSDRETRRADVCGLYQSNGSLLISSSFTSASRELFRFRSVRIPLGIRLPSVRRSELVGSFVHISIRYTCQYARVRVDDRVWDGEDMHITGPETTPLDNTSQTSIHMRYRERTEHDELNIRVTLEPELYRTLRSSSEAVRH